MKSVVVALFACVVGLLLGLGYMHNQNKEQAVASPVVVVPDVGRVAVFPTVPKPVARVEPEVEAVEVRIPVLIGDTQKMVYDFLGDPRLEFPKDGAQIMWYAGYEIVLTNGIVARIKDRPIETKEERLDRASYAASVDRRISAGYRAMNLAEQREHVAWIERMRLARIERAAERKRLKDYEDRRSREKRAAERSGGTIYVEHGY